MRIHPPPWAVALLSLCLLTVFQPAGAQPPAKPTPEQVEADQLFAAKKWKEAAAKYRRLAEANPKDGRSLFRQAYALQAGGDREEALKVYEKAMAFPPLRPISLYNSACAHAVLGQKEKALDALEKAIDAGVSDKAMIEKDDDLRSLREEPRFQKALTRTGLYRQFDFWVGEWDVVNAKGTPIGKSSIQLLEGGHLILENWDNLKGGTGKSINFVDPADRQWKQIWVDKGGGVTRYAGAFTDGAMRFEGTATRKDGGQELSRMTFKPLPDGRVHQHIDHSKDGGKTWSVYFDGYYVPRKK